MPIRLTTFSIPPDGRQHTHTNDHHLSEEIIGNVLIHVSAADSLCQKREKRRLDEEMLDNSCCTRQLMETARSFGDGEHGPRTECSPFVSVGCKPGPPIRCERKTPTSCDQTGTNTTQRRMLKDTRQRTATTTTQGKRNT